MILLKMCKSVIVSFVFLFSTIVGFGQSIHVVIHTNMGDMKAVLFDDTPRHRDEFVRLAKSQYFNGTLFYRSVKNFVIQGGSSDSRNARPGQRIGYGDGAINIPSEFTKNHFHKFGALCAPRQPDKINFLKTSDISQFYIVRGQVYPDSILDKLERVVNNPIKKKLKQQYYYPRKAELDELKAAGDKEGYKKLLAEIKEKFDFEYSISNYKEFTPEQREAYTTIGGTPDLDKEYTVFGQVVEGLDVVKKINNLKTDANERPTTDVKIIRIDVIQ